MAQPYSRVLRRPNRLRLPALPRWVTAGYRRPLLAAVLAIISLQWADWPLALIESLQPLADGSLAALALCYAVWWSLLLWMQLATDLWASNKRIAPSRRYQHPLMAAALTLISTQWVFQPLFVTESLQPLAIGNFVALALCYAVWWCLLPWLDFATGRR